MDKLLINGNQLYYNGDFDPEGLIIAHKLSNVMKCDKIIVMDDGKVIEFDEPKKLYENNNSMFRQLCNSSDVII